MSKTFGRFAASLAKAATAPLSRWRGAMARAHAAELITPDWTIDTSAGRMVFRGPSGRALQDAHGFNRDEPETVAWIESMPKDAVFWDIGANVGVYAIFAAKRGVKVLAFEPAAATLAVLVQNIERNRVDALVDAFPIALAETTRLDYLYMDRARTAPGHAVHSFGTRDTVAGEIAEPFKQAAIGYSADSFIAQFGAAPATHVKLDVDGIESAILRGARAMMTTSVRELMVEIYEDMAPAQAADIRSIVAELGFVEKPTVNPEGRNKLFARG